MKIIFLGDSLTQGVYGGDFVTEIAALRPNDEIINAGVSGSTVLNLESRLDDIIAQAPDAVFLMVGGNDSISYSQPATRPYYKKSQNVPDGAVTPEMFAQTYRDILQRLQLEFIQVWVGLPPKEYNPQTVESQKQYNDIARDIARSLNIPVLDLMEHFLPDTVQDRQPIDLGLITTIGQRSAAKWNDYEAEREKHGFTYSFDGIHITPATAKTFAQLIHEFIG
jgi:lysophospholipase L1-like esterase